LKGTQSVTQNAVTHQSGMCQMSLTAPMSFESMYTQSTS